MKSAIKRLIVRLVPRSVRKFLSIWLSRQAWLPPANRSYWATELLTDFAATNPNDYHKFLWKHHMAYAETYEIDLRFGYEKLNDTRKLLFGELPQRMQAAGLGRLEDVRSVFEVGCSLGYLLRYMETDVCPGAGRLEGIDIDAHAIAEGSRYLAGVGSKVVLHQGDMESVGEYLGGEKFDIVLASGVLLYLDQESAAGLVSGMLEHTGKLLVITALAHPETDNALMKSSVLRERDGTWIHNVDRMIESAGGQIVARRYQGAEMLDGNSIYFLYAVPGAP